MPLNPLEEESEAARLKHKFGAGSQHTKVFEYWDRSIQTFFRSRIKFEDGERPIFAHYRLATDWLSTIFYLLVGRPSAANWLLLTTCRILWANPDKIFRELRLENIETVG